MNWTDLSVRRPVLVTVTFIGVALFAGYAATLLPISLFPDIEPPVVSVVTSYPGADSQDVEDKVTEPIEEALSGVAELDEMSSTSQRNVSIVTLEYSFDTDLDAATADVRQQMELARQEIPDEVEEPLIFRLDTSSFPIMILGVTSSEGEVTEHRELLEDRMVDPLKRISGVGSVSIFGGPEREVKVEVDQERLRAHHLTMPEVAQVIGAENVSVPAGELDVGSEMFSARMPAEFESLEEMRHMIVTRTDDSVVRLGDIAEVSIGLEQFRETSRVNGESSIAVGVQKQSDANTVAVARSVREKLEGISEDLPDQFEVTTVRDNSEFVEGMVWNLTQTVLIAALAIIFVVLLFLREWRSSFVVSLALPASTLLVFLVMYIQEYSLNAISMMAISLALGIVVDNSIVVIENINRHLEQGASAARAALDGTQEVGTAILASALTTISIFLPLIFVGGMIGIFFGQLAVVMSTMVISSLIVALTLSPSVASQVLKSGDDVSEGAADTGGLFERIEGLYQTVIEWALRFRWLVVTGALGLMVGTGFLVATVGVDFMPQQNQAVIQVTAEMPVGTNYRKSAEVGRQLAEPFRDDPRVEHVYVRSGSAGGGAGAAIGGDAGEHIAQATYRLVPIGEREADDREFADEIREVAEKIPEIADLSVTYGGGPGASIMGGGGKPVTVELLGDNIDDLETAARQVESIVDETPGTKDVSADLIERRPEIRFDLDRERATRFGVKAGQVGAALRTAFYGQVVTRYRGGDEDLDIFLRFREEDRASAESIEDIEVRGTDGRSVRLGAIGELVEAQSPIAIERLSEQRMIDVGANTTGRALGDITADIERKLAETDFPSSVSVQFGGDIEEQREAFGGLQFALLLGVILVYLVMAGQFESYLDPFVILFAIPFAMTGGLLALLVSGTTLSVPAFLGLIILVGVVVNQAIVLVDYVNMLRAEHDFEFHEAVVEGARRRLRPIMMTTLTTAAGMLPLALASGQGSATWQPIGRAALGGVLFSMCVTLVLIPVLYHLTERFRGDPGDVDLEGSDPVPDADGTLSNS